MSNATKPRQQLANRVTLDEVTYSWLVKANRLNLMIDMLNEVAVDMWRPTSEEQRPAGLKEGEVPAFDLTDCQSPSDCGFSACAIGYACLDKRFNDLGLKSSLMGLMTPMYQGVQSWDALQEFFGIASDDLYFLFSIDEYQSSRKQEGSSPNEYFSPGPSIVAQRIELFLRRLKDNLENA